MFESEFDSMCLEAGIPESAANKMKTDAHSGRCVLGVHYEGHGFRYPGTVLCEGLGCKQMWTCPKYQEYLRSRG